MQVSIIIVSFYTGPALWLSIASVLREPECGEVILVNNGNMPGDLKRLEKMAAEEPRIRLLSGHGNVGFGKGNNLGVSQASGDYVLLLNPDSILPEGGLAGLLEEMAHLPENTLAGCHLINPDGSEQRGGRRALLTPRNAVAESLGLGRFLAPTAHLNFNHMPMPEHTHQIPVISGAFMFLARSFYQRLGGFDEGYFLHMEDMDFCYRVHQAGGRVICIPAVKVIHFRSTSEVTSSFIERHKAKGFVRYLRKYFSEQHPKPFLRLMECGIYARLWAKIAAGQLDRLFVPPLAAKHEIARLALIYNLVYFQEQADNLSGKVLLVAGATTPIGLSVVGRALARGAQVVALYDRDAVAFAHPCLEWIKCDLARAVDVADFSKLKTDMLISAAELHLLPGFLPQLCDGGLKRAVIFSASAVADEAYIRNSYEKERVKEIKAVESKVMQISGERGCATTMLRPLMPYGVGFDRQISAIADIIRRFGFAAVYREGSGRRNPVKAVDAADSALAMAENAATFGKAYNIGGGETLTYREMVLRIFEYAGKPSRLRQVPWMPEILNLLGRVYQMRHINGEMAWRMNRDISFDNTPAIGDFNYRPAAFLEGDITL